LTPEPIAGALLLAAGLGTRLRPLTDFLPKCLAPIRGRPLLEYWLRDLTQAGIERIVVNTHYRADLVESWLEAGPFADRVVAVREQALLGTGGTLLANAARFPQGPLLVAHADNLSLFDVKAFVAAHAARPAEACLTMMTFTTDEPEQCGIVSTDERGLVEAFYEKVANPPGNHANAAVYIVEPEVVRFIASLGSSVVDLSTEVIPRFLGRMTTWHNKGYHRDIGNLPAWRAAQHEYPGSVPVASADDSWSKILSAAGPELGEAIDDLLAEPLARES
jgi:mannose-1-phosphate guanylyltransferase